MRTLVIFDDGRIAVQIDCVAENHRIDRLLDAWVKNVRRPIGAVEHARMFCMYALPKLRDSGVPFHLAVTSAQDLPFDQKLIVRCKDDEGLIVVNQQDQQ